jgi:hypothetical protein
MRRGTAHTTARITARIALVVTGILLAAFSYAQEAPVGTRGITVYVNRVVAAPQGEVSLGALVRSSGQLSPSEQEALLRGVTVLGSSVQFLPASLYQAWIEAAFGRDAIIVGSRTLLIPKGTAAENEAYVLDRVADYLVAQKLVGSARVEMTFTQGGLTGTPPQDGTPSFQVTRSVRGVEVSFLLAGSSGSVNGRVTIASADAAPGAQYDAQSGVRSSSAVRVVFHKGPITVEVPGRALAAASVGDTVRVSISESQKTFTGRLGEGKAVQVDLP